MMAFLPWFLLSAALSAAAGAGAAASEKWPGARSSLESLAESTADVVAAVAKGNAEVRTRTAARMSTATTLRNGQVIRGGGMVTFAHCRQKFQVREVLHGKGEAGDCALEYGFVEKAQGFPLPAPGQPIPDGAKVILLLGEKGTVLKALPDNPENRRAVRDAFARKGDTKK
jgi:hypothetical protein